MVYFTFFLHNTQCFSLWPQYVKDRIKATYGYIAGSLMVTAGSAITVFRTPALLNLVARNGWMVSYFMKSIVQLTKSFKEVI